MPKKKRSRGGHQRPKKRKLEQTVAIEEDADDADVGDGAEEAEEEPPPAPEPILP